MCGNEYPNIDYDFIDADGRYYDAMRCLKAGMSGGTRTSPTWQPLRGSRRLAVIGGRTAADVGGGLWF